MVIDLKQLFDTEGGQVAIDCALDLRDRELWGVYPFHAPVLIKGSIVNRWGMVELEATASADLCLVCSRCLQEVRTNQSFAMHYTITQDEQKEDGETVFFVPQPRLDLADLVYSHFLLTLPSKVLCKEDCKGLCAKCGINLNLETCNCKVDMDPRLAILGTLLE